MTTTHDWRDVLLKAASIVEEGWCQGVSHRDVHEHPCRRSAAVRSCAGGAIGRAVQEMDVFANARGFAHYRLADHVGARAVSEWNDAPGRTATEVAEAMREAAVTEGVI